MPSKPKGRKNIRKPIGDNALVQELKQSVVRINGYFNQITKARELHWGLPLSVELRRLYSPIRGNNLLIKIESILNIKFKFKVMKAPPDTYEDVGVKKYRNNLAFVSNGDPYTKLDVIKSVVNQRGAHTDSNMETLHFDSPHILLPWKNPAKTKLLIPQDLHILLSIAEQTIHVIGKQLP